MATPKTATPREGEPADPVGASITDLCDLLLAWGQAMPAVALPGSTEKLHEIKARFEAEPTPVTP